MIRGYKLTSILILILASFVLAGCSSTPEPASAVKRPCPVKILAVAPMVAADASGDGASVICPITTEVFSGSKVSPLAVTSLSARLPKALEAHFGCRIITPGRLSRDLLSRSGSRGKLVRQALTKAALENGAQAVLTGTIFKYRERVGSNIGVEQSASVYFALYLIDVRDSRVVWQGFFRETQKSLSEDIFKAAKFFDRGGRWLTADELSDYGLDKTIRSMTSLMPE